MSALLVPEQYQVHLHLLARRINEVLKRSFSHHGENRVMANNIAESRPIGKISKHLKHHNIYIHRVLRTSHHQAFSECYIDQSIWPRIKWFYKLTQFNANSIIIYCCVPLTVYILVYRPKRSYSVFYLMTMRIMISIIEL